MENKNTNQAGLQCPECGFFINITISELLRNDNFRCPGCGLVISMDQSSSLESLKKLSQLQATMDNVNMIRKK